VAARSKARVCGRSLFGIAGSNPAGAWVSVSGEYCVLSGRGLCVGLVTRPTECGVSECDREAPIVRRPWLAWGYCAMKKILTGLWAVKPTNCSISSWGECFSAQSVSTEVLSPWVMRPGS
jgi:hypothetical protein